MAQLAYCMLAAEAAATLELPSSGVRGSPLQQAEADGVVCVFSAFEIPPDDAGLDREGALAFHGVLRHIFGRTAIVPFRFPTLLESPQAVRDYLAIHASHYREALHRFRDLVQMELRISSAATPAPASSGAQYLRSKQAASAALKAMAQEARSAVADLALEWRERTLPRGVHCFALVARSAVEDFRRRVAAMRPAHGVDIIVSAPWPPTDFLPPAPEPRPTVPMAGESP